MAQRTIDRMLCGAAIYGRSELAQLLLDAGANVQTKGDYPILLAAYYGNTTTLKVLLKVGLNIYNYDNHALTLAACRGNFKAARMMHTLLKRRKVS